VNSLLLTRSVVRWYC